MIVNPQAAREWRSSEAVFDNDQIILYDESRTEYEFSYRFHLVFIVFQLFDQFGDGQ
jgi:hypothetical protein